ncbi:MAG: hypothetical protein ABI577_06405 [bacterium]
MAADNPDRNAAKPLADTLGTLHGEDKATAEKLLQWLTADWDRERRGKSHPEAVEKFQREALDESLGEAKGEEFLGRLRGFVLQRKAEQLSLRTLELGKEIKSGAVKDPDARTRGKALLKQVEALAAEAKLLPAAVPALQRELGEAMMEALYAVERKGMSQRLEREVT